MASAAGVLIRFRATLCRGGHTTCRSRTCVSIEGLSRMDEQGSSRLPHFPDSCCGGSWGKLRPLAMGDAGGGEGPRSEGVHGHCTPLDAHASQVWRRITCRVDGSTLTTC
eukprot:scaffold685_cov281-Pinguiococcus_pyrenoidosus.AAC.18